MRFKVVETTLSSAVAASGTFTVNYPASHDEDSFAGYGHKATAIGNVMSSPGDFTLTFGSASITFTYGSGKTTLPAGTKVRLQLNLAGANDKDLEPNPLNDIPGVRQMAVVEIDLGSPLVADVDGIVDAVTPTATGSLTMAGTAVSGGEADLATGLGGAKFGRNVTVDMTGASTTAVITVTGEDYLENAMSEAITLNGTTAVAGKKAFAKVTDVSIDATANVAGLDVGFGDVLGLPFYVPSVDHVLLELENNVTATAGTFVAGVDSAATTTTGDVRGTYDPNSACDGAKNFRVVVASANPQYKGVDQA